MAKEFFGSIRNMAKAVEKIDQDKILKKVIDDPLVKAQIIDLNTEKQLYEEGVDSAGNSLGNYSPATIYGTKSYEGKIAKGQRYDHITLKDTGKFYSSFKIVNEKQGFFITANTLKGKTSITQNFDTNTQSVRGIKIGETDLAEEFGPKILGLSDESLNEIIPEIKESFIEEIRSEIFGAGN